MGAQNNNSTSGSVGSQTTATPFQVFGAGDAAGNIHLNVSDTTCQVNISANGNPELTVNSHAILCTVDTFSISAASGTGSLAFASDGKLTMGGASGLYLNINSASGMLKINGTQVVSTRKTGWTAWTGGGSRATKAVSTATTADCAAAIKSILDDLGTTASGHGLLDA